MVLVKQGDWFPTAKKDAVGRVCIPVKLKVNRRNDGKKWLKLFCVDDIVPTAVSLVNSMFARLETDYEVRNQCFYAVLEAMTTD